MKLLTSFQQSQISGGGIITINGSKYYVNTLGIPQNCILLFESLYDAGMKEVNKPNSTKADLDNVADKYFNPISNAGCLDHFELFSNNFPSRIKIT